jgi:hypothetical protein
MSQIVVDTDVASYLFNWHSLAGFNWHSLAGGTPTPCADPSWVCRSCRSQNSGWARFQPVGAHADDFSLSSSCAASNCLTPTTISVPSGQGFEQMDVRQVGQRVRKTPGSPRPRWHSMLHSRPITARITSTFRGSDYSPRDAARPVRSRRCRVVFAGEASVLSAS